MPLDVTPLSNAVQRLREGLARHQAEPNDEQLRDGLIKRFESTDELSHNTLRRYLQEILPFADSAARMTFGELVRTGNEQGLLRAEWPAWRHFREAFDESDLPYRVDVVDWQAISPEFRSLIAADRRRLARAPTAAA